MPPISPPDPVRVAVIAPVVTSEERLGHVPDVDGVVVKQQPLSFGTNEIESRWDDAFAVPGVIDAAVRAERDGADAVIINCMDDPGLDAAREVVRIPVVGPAQASMHLALTLANRFAIITTSGEDVPIVRELVERYRLEERCSGIRYLGLSPLSLGNDEEQTFRVFLDAARMAVEDDGAAAIIAGCTLLSGKTDRLAEALAELTPAVPVIDPLEAALHHARTLVRLGVSHSGTGYPEPEAKTILWPANDSAPLFGPASTALEVRS